MADRIRTGGPAGTDNGGRTNNRMPFKEKIGLTREYCVDFSLFIGKDLRLTPPAANLWKFVEISAILYFDWDPTTF